MSNDALGDFRCLPTRRMQIPVFSPTLEHSSRACRVWILQCHLPLVLQYAMEAAWAPPHDQFADFFLKVLD